MATAKGEMPMTIVKKTTVAILLALYNKEK